MVPDPIVDEIQETRRRLIQECGDDLQQLLESFKSAEGQDKERIVAMDEVRRRAAQSRSKA